MSIELNTVNSFTKSFDIKIPSTDYEKQYDKSMKKVAKNVSLPGFRKGKVPATLLKKQFHDSIHGETIDKLVQKNFEKACEEHKQHPLGNVNVSKLDVADDNSIDFTVSFEVRPELTDLKYSGLKLEKSVRKISDQDIDITLENIQAQQSKTVDLADDAEIKEGSFVVVDSQQLDEEKNPIEGKLYKNMTIEVGSGKFDKKIEKQLIGLKVGDVKDVEKKYPKNSKNKELAGKSEYFTFTINSLEEKEVPEINDELAKSLNEEGIETLEDLKGKIKSTLSDRFEQESRELFINEIAQKIVDANEVELPASMIDNYLERLFEQTKQQRQGNLSEERFKSARRESAEFELKWQLIKEEISTENSLKVDTHTDEGKKEVEDYIDSLPFPDDQKKMIKSSHHYMHDMAYQVEDKKVIDFIEENNTVKEKEIKPE